MDNKVAEDYRLEQAKAEDEARGRAEGIVEGEARGEAREKMMIAKKLLSQNVDTTIISAATGLSV